MRFGLEPLEVLADGIRWAVLALVGLREDLTRLPVRAFRFLGSEGSGVPPIPRTVPGCWVYRVRAVIGRLP